MTGTRNVVVTQITHFFGNGAFFGDRHQFFVLLQSFPIKRKPRFLKTPLYQRFGFSTAAKYYIGVTVILQVPVTKKEQSPSIPSKKCLSPVTVNCSPSSRQWKYKNTLSVNNLNFASVLSFSVCLVLCKMN